MYVTGGIIGAIEAIVCTIFWNWLLNYSFNISITKLNSHTIWIAIFALIGIAFICYTITMFICNFIQKVKNNKIQNIR